MAENKFFDKINLEHYHRYVSGMIKRLSDNIDERIDEKFKNFIEDNVSDGEILDSRGGERTLGDRLNKFDEKYSEVSSQLEHNVVENVNKNICSYITNDVFNNEGGHLSLSFIGDSFSAYGLVNDIEENYINLLNKQIKKVTNGGLGVTQHPILNNFSEAYKHGLIIEGDFNIGNKGSCKNSLILNQNACITLKKDFDYLDLYIENGVGQLEFSIDGNIYKRIDIKNGFTFINEGFIDIPDGTNIKIVCKGSNVEISSLLRLNKTTSSSIYVNRIAQSGTTTEYWVDNLDNIYNSVSLGGNTKGFVVLALGTNNIYSPNATTSNKYYNDLKVMANYFIDKGMYVILVCEPRAKEDLFPTIVEPYENYKNKVIQLSNELELPLIRLDKLDLVRNMNDGVHPNVAGNKKMFNYYKDYLGIPTNITKEVYKEVVNDLKITSYQNGWSDFIGIEYGVRVKRINNTVYLDGLCSGGNISDSAIIFTLDEQYRPARDKFFVVSSSHNPATISIRANGEVICKNNIDNTFISFDGIVYNV